MRLSRTRSQAADSSPVALAVYAAGAFPAIAPSASGEDRQRYRIGWKCSGSVSRGPRVRVLKGVFVVFAVLGLWGCNKDPNPPFKPSPRPAPILSYSVVNPPQIDVPRRRGDQVLAEMRMIPLGSTIQIRNNEPISLQTAELGQTFPGIVERDVLDSKGLVAIPRGSEATLVVLRISSKGERVLDIGGIAVAGRRYGLEALKHGGASAKTANIAAATLMSFQLESPANIRELR